MIDLVLLCIGRWELEILVKFYDDIKIYIVRVREYVRESRRMKSYSWKVDIVGFVLVFLFVVKLFGLIYSVFCF